MLVMIDLDNTLGDRARAVDAWAREFVGEHGIDVGAVADIVDLDADGYSDRRTVFSTLRRTFELQASVDDLLDRYRTRIIELTTLVDGAAECLTSMRARGWSVVIVTNGSSGQQHAKVDATGLRSLVDAVVVSGDIGISKPDRRIFEIAAERVDRPLGGSWMVGDSVENDILGAARLGMRTAWLDRGRSWTQRPVVPDVVVGSLDRLVGSIESVEG